MYLFFWINFKYSSCVISTFFGLFLGSLDLSITISTIVVFCFCSCSFLFQLNYLQMIAIFLLFFYFVFSLSYGVRLTTNTSLGFPSVLNSLSASTFLFLFFILFFFELDFLIRDGIFFFNNTVITFFLLVIMCFLLASSDFNASKSIIKFEHDFLVLSAVVSGWCLCFADDFLMFYLALELQSFTFFLFATFNRNSEFSTESGLKYFIFGAVISTLLLVGISIFYSTFGSTSFELIFSLFFLIHDPAQILGFFFVLLSLFFKIGAAPFHVWLCDVYDGAVLTITLLFSSAPKIILFSLILKFFFFYFFEIQDFWRPLLFFIGLLSIFCGIFAAFYQKRIKRLLAFSTITHTGFILLGFLGYSAEASKTIVTYLVIYVFLTLLTFALLLFASSKNNGNPKFLANWTASGLKNIFFTLSLTMVFFSMAGVPPLSGFFAKLVVLLTCISKKYFITSIFIIILSSTACFYYLRLIKIFFFSKYLKNTFWLAFNSTQKNEILVALAFIFNLFFFLRSSFVSNISTAISLSVIL